MAQAILSEPVSTGNGSQGIMPVLSLVNGKPRASSVAVAEHFKKRHKDVLRSITQTCHNLPEDFCGRNFALTSVEVPQPKGGTRQERAYLMTRDGFTLIVMSFTGKEAMAWKLRYIEAFNAMEAELATQQQAPASLTLTPSQQQELKELVQAKASAYPAEARGKIIAQVWSRVQRKFKVPRYAELPAAVFGDARGYIITMQIRGGEVEALAAPQSPKALPATLESYCSHSEFADDMRASIYLTVRMSRNAINKDLDAMTRAVEARFPADTQEAASRKYVVDTIRSGLARSVDIITKELGTIREIATGMDAWKELLLGSCAGAGR